MQRYSFLAISMLLILCLSCEMGEQTDQHMPKGGWVSGTIFEDGTANGLNSANINYGHISLDSSSILIYTDTEGRYSFYSGFNSGMYEVAASKQGYETEKKEIEVIREDTVNLDFYLKRRK